MQIRFESGPREQRIAKKSVAIALASCSLFSFVQVTLGSVHLSIESLLGLRRLHGHRISALVQLYFHYFEYGMRMRAQTCCMYESLERGRARIPNH